jgi:deazaflavin-dependent oxidoreductase (nitroreductase family)
MGWYSELSTRAVRLNPRIGVPLGRLHAWLNGVSGGRIGNTFITRGAPILFLTTAGRRTGKTRVTPLIYARDGERYVVAASNAGAAPSPAWFLNVMAAGTADLRVGRESATVTPAVAEGAERERLWRLLTSVYADYDHYQRVSDREIPVVVLTPTTPGPPG